MAVSTVPFTFEQRLQDDALIVTLRGVVDTAAALDPVGELALQSPATQVVVDLSGVDYINSAGFGSLVRLSDTISRSKRQIYVVGLQSKIRVVFNTLGAGALFNVLPDIPSALARIRNG